MSFLVATPDIVSAAATELAGLGSTINSANAAAATATTGVLPAALDEVSAAIAAMFGAHGQAYHALSAQAAAFQQEFVQLVSASANAYANAEANVVHTLTGGAAAAAQGITPFASILPPLENLQLAYHNALINGEMGLNTSVVNGEIALEKAIFGTDSALNGFVNRAFNAFNLGLLGTGEEFINGLSGAGVFQPAFPNLNSSLIIGPSNLVFNSGQIGGPLGALDQGVVAGLDLLGLPFAGTGSSPFSAVDDFLRQVEAAQINFNTTTLVANEVSFNQGLLSSEIQWEMNVFGSDSTLNGTLNRAFNIGNLLLVNTPEEIVNGLTGATALTAFPPIGTPPASFNALLLTGETNGTFNGGQFGGPVGAFDQSLSFALNAVGLVGIIFGIGV